MSDSYDSDEEEEKRKKKLGPSFRKETPRMVQATMAAELAAMQSHVDALHVEEDKVKEERKKAEAAIKEAKYMEKRTELGFPIPRELEEYKPGDPRPLSASELRVLNMSNKANNLPLVEAPELPPDSRWLARPKDSVFSMPESRDNTAMMEQRPKGSKCFYMMGEMEDQSDTGVQYIIELKDLWRPVTWLADKAIRRLQDEGGEWGPRVKGYPDFDPKTGVHTGCFDGESDTWVEVGPYKRYPIDTSLEDIPEGANVRVRWRNHPKFIQKKEFFPPAPEELPDFERYERERTWELMEPPYPRDEFYALECEAHMKEPRGALSELETYLFTRYKYETAVTGTATGLKDTALKDGDAVRAEVKQMRTQFEKQKADLEAAEIEYDRQQRVLLAMKSEVEALEGYIADDRE